MNIGGLQLQQAQLAAVVQDAEAGRDARVESLAFYACDGAMARQPADQQQDGLLPLAIGGSIHKQVTGDATRLDAIHREVHDFGERWGAQDESPCSSERQLLQRMVQIGEHGEIALMRSEPKRATSRWR